MGPMHHIGLNCADPIAIEPLPDGSLLIVSMKDHRLMRRWPDGRVTQHADVSRFCDDSFDFAKRMLEAGKDFGRYLDVDNDGIPYRTLPGTHPTKGSFFTRGTSRDRYARYTEEGPAYVDNMQRLLRKFETAKTLVPAPIVTRAAKPTTIGIAPFGTTSGSSTALRSKSTTG